MNPIRSCIICRQRFYQNELNRFQCKENKLINFTGTGRSFYICNSCIYTKKSINKLNKMCKIDKITIKEIIRSLLENKNI